MKRCLLTAVGQQTRAESPMRRCVRDKGDCDRSDWAGALQLAPSLSAQEELFDSDVYYCFSVASMRPVLCHRASSIGFRRRTNHASCLRHASYASCFGLVHDVCGPSGQASDDMTRHTFH